MSDRPNLLVFFCDQLRIDLLGAYGDSLVRTPNLDALAGEASEKGRPNRGTGIPARAPLSLPLSYGGPARRRHVLQPTVPDESRADFVAQERHVLLRRTLSVRQRNRREHHLPTSQDFGHEGVETRGWPDPHRNREKLGSST